MQELPRGPFRLTADHHEFVRRRRVPPARKWSFWRYAGRMVSKEGPRDGPKLGHVVPPLSALDTTDREILRILQKDGRTSNSAIARQLGITETTVRKRIAAMLDRDLMEIVAVPTPRLAGYNISAIIGLSVSLPHLREVSGKLVEAPEVRYCGLSTGRFDVMIEAFFYDREHLLRFTTDVLGALPGITAVETSLILKIEKFSYEWELG